MNKIPLLKSVIVFLLFLAIAVAVTWPLLIELRTSLPIGTERTLTIPLFGLWSLLWNAEQLFHLFHGYWDAPIFHPAAGTFAFSETMLPEGIIFGVGIFLLDDPVLVYNLMILVCIALNGVGAFSLLRTIGIAYTPSVLAGALASTLPYVANELGVFQLIVLFPIFYFFSEFYKFSNTPKIKHAIGMGLWGAILSLSCSYYGLFLSVFAILGFFCLCKGSCFSPKALVYLLCGAGLAAAIAFPVLLKQLSITSEFSHSPTAMHLNSCVPVDFLALHPIFYGNSIFPSARVSGALHPMYPGTGLLILAVIGAWAGRKRAPRWVLFCIAGGGIAMALSMGVNLELFGWRPLDLLRRYYPGFQQLRNSFRFGVFVQIFLVCLSGFALELLWERKHKLGRLITLLIVFVSIVEVLPITQLQQVPKTVFASEWAPFLKDQPEGPVLMLPMAVEDEHIDYHYEPIVIGMIQALNHKKPLLNGLSTFQPECYRELKTKMADFPNSHSLNYLCQRNVSYIVVDKSPENAAPYKLNTYGMLKLLYEGNDKAIYSLECGER